MATQYENEFKVMIAELYQSGIKAKQISDEYAIYASKLDVGAVSMNPSLVLFPKRGNYLLRSKS